MNEHRRKLRLLFQRARQRHAFADQRGCALRRAPQRRHVNDFGGRVERAQQRRATAHENGERAGEARRVEASCKLAGDGYAQQPRVPARAKGRTPVGQPEGRGRDHNERQPQPSGRAEKCARRDQRLREPGQRLAALLIDRNHLRHDIRQQHRDRSARARPSAAMLRALRDSRQAAPARPPVDRFPHRRRPIRDTAAKRSADTAPAPPAALPRRRRASAPRQ